MSKESRKSLTGSGRKGRTDRPIAPAVLKEAGRHASGYRVVVEPAGKAGFIGWAIEMPGVLADGKTPDACLRSTYEALTTTVAVMLEAGEQPPMPARRGRRSAQVNVRLSAEEKLVIEEAARRQGYQGVADFFRAAALRECGMA